MAERNQCKDRVEGKIHFVEALGVNSRDQVNRSEIHRKTSAGGLAGHGRCNGI